MAELLKYIPKMLIGEELKRELTSISDYSSDARNKETAERLILLSDIYKLYIPTKMSEEIYAKLYLGLYHSLQKKDSKEAIRQGYINFKTIKGQTTQGIIGGADSFTIIGTSGIGKSSAINKSIELLNKNGIIKTESPFAQVVPCIVVQCPFDSSAKGLLLEILRKVDEVLGSTYYEKAIRCRATTDMLIGMVSEVSLNHIGVLVVDEIQNVVECKNGPSLLRVLMQLINNSGISICMVGTKESELFFEEVFQLARRCLGLNYTAMPYDSEFYRLAEIIFSIQYVKNPTMFNEAYAMWLYEHSGGIVSILITLIHDAQEIAILDGREILDFNTLGDAFQKRLGMLHSFIIPKTDITKGNLKKVKLPSPHPSVSNNENISISQAFLIAKNQGSDIVSILKKMITIEEVCI